MDDALPTLLFPYERDLLPPPQKGERLLLFGASGGFRPPLSFQAEMEIVQDFRPDFLALERAGLRVVPQAQGENLDATLLLLGRHRQENEARLAEALSRVRPGGLVVAAGTKKDGAQSIARRAGDLLPLENRLSKHHGIVFWLHRPQVLDEAVLDALTPAPSSTPEGYETAIGGFCGGTVDPGSKLMADSLPADISGRVADFAAGWGYLSLRVAERFSPAMLDLYEAHRPSLEAAKRNLAAHSPGTESRFFWHDLLEEPVEHSYDTIVMNPPFHRGRAAEPDIGRRLIEVAAKALRSGGRLFLVANRPLPYEATMRAAFSRHGEISRDDTYKVLWGVK